MCLCHAQGNFCDLVGAIAQWMALRFPRIPVDGAYVWIDICSVNQHEGGADLTTMRELIAVGDQPALAYWHVTRWHRRDW